MAFEGCSHGIRMPGVAVAHVESLITFCCHVCCAKVVGASPREKFLFSLYTHTHNRNASVR